MNEQNEKCSNFSRETDVHESENFNTNRYIVRVCMIIIEMGNLFINLWKTLLIPNDTKTSSP
jgi:hypothetical protein